MNRYVLIISVGPVQGFIAAARRSRDLWSGSWLLSEMSKAVAKYLSDLDKVELIFPYTTQPDIDLKPDSDFSVGNKIQVVVEAENTEKVKKIAKDASDEAKKCFQEIATVAFVGLSRRHLLRKNIWEQQLDDYVETQAAWAKIVDGQYHEASKNAAKVLAARKATRNFGQTTAHALDRAFMVPKSSLDGTRETILPEEKDIGFGLRSQLGLSDSEQLDCAGITKRLGGDSQQFTPFTRVAAHFWIQENLTDQQREVIRQAYKPLVGDPLKLATEVKGNTDDSGKSIYSDLPFDAQLLYPARLEAALVSTKKKAKDDPDAQKAYDALVEFKQKLEKAEVWKTSQPCSYGVLLLADGDRMGELLDAARSEKEHQSITQALSEFASSVADIMRKHSGHCIYAGGDDVLGLVPLNTAYKCARDLSQIFKEKMQVALQNLDQAQSVKNAPTLSVGLAIAHHMTPLGIIRELAKQAEGIAKGNSEPLDQQRNALGITLAVRSGATTNIRLPWTDDDGKEHPSQKALELWQEAYTKKAIPSRIAYDAQAIHLRTKFALDHENGSKIQLAEFSRMIDRAKLPETSNSSSKKSMKEREKDFEQVKKDLMNHFKDTHDLEKLANELIVARWLAAKTARDISMES